MSAYKRDDKEFKAKLARLADKKKTVQLPETKTQEKTFMNFIRRIFNV